MMEPETRIVEYVKQETTVAEELVVQAQNLNISNKGAVQGASDWLKDVKGKIRALENHRKSIVGPINESIKRINDLFKGPIGIYGEIERHIKAAMLDWNHREAERIRIEREAEERKAEAKRKRFETWSKKAEERGDLEKAEELLAKSMEVEPDPVPAKIEKPEGSYVIKRWKAIVTNKEHLVNAISSGELALDAVEPNMVFLNGLARRLKGAVKIPGVRFVEEESVGQRREPA